ncbi:MAG: hypothetical protein LBS72_00045 [Oscillospiraceae bacterium]|jgi:hypothetical protein|nr:hypothetical protein [Oscillospiraceae bacterium]
MIDLALMAIIVGLICSAVSAAVAWSTLKRRANEPMEQLRASIATLREDYNKTHYDMEKQNAEISKMRGELMRHNDARWEESAHRSAKFEANLSSSNACMVLILKALRAMLMDKPETELMECLKTIDEFLIEKHLEQ